MIKAILFDRDGTLIVDRAQDVVAIPYAREALDLVRRHGLRVGVVTNQPGVQTEKLPAIHERIEAAVGPIDAWFVCTHRDSEACDCRKPQPGLVLRAADAFEISPNECAVIGDIGSDVDAAVAAGAQAVLVPTGVTLLREIERAPVVCSTLLEAVEHVTGAYVKQ